MPIVRRPLTRPAVFHPVAHLPAHVSAAELGRPRRLPPLPSPICCATAQRRALPLSLAAGISSLEAGRAGGYRDNCRSAPRAHDQAYDVPSAKDARTLAFHAADQIADPQRDIGAAGRANLCVAPFATLVPSRQLQAHASSLFPEIHIDPLSRPFPIDAMRSRTIRSNFVSLVVERLVNMC